jgi:hypothetical protein
MSIKEAEELATNNEQRIAFLQRKKELTRMMHHEPFTDEDENELVLLLKETGLLWTKIRIAKESIEI